MNANATPKKDGLDASGWLLLVAAVALFVPYFSKLLVWAHQAGHCPIKPWDYNLTLAPLVGLLVLLRRPAFSLLGLCFLIVPAARVLDAVLLRRFVLLGGMEDHASFALQLLSTLVISLCAVLCLADRRGYQIAQAVAAGVTLVVCGSIYFEALGGAALSSEPGRMAGFLADPNAGPLTLCLMLGVLFTLNRRFWLNLTLAAVAAPAIALTYSRSGITIFAVLTLLYLARHFWRHALSLSLLTGLGVPAMVAGMVALDAAAPQGAMANVKVKNHLKAIYGLEFSKSAAEDRVRDLEDGWEAVGRRPLLGYGTGASAARWLPRNAVISLWLEVGIGGVLLFLGPLLLLSCQCLVNHGRGFYALAPVWLFLPCSEALMSLPAFWLAVATCCHVAMTQRVRFSLLGARRG